VEVGDLGGESDFDNVCKEIANSIGVMRGEFPTSNSFSCLKVTGLSRGSLLARVTDLLVYQQQNPSFQLPWRDASVPIAQHDYKGTCFERNAAPAPLDANELLLLQNLIARLDRVAAKAAEANMPLLVDAEETYYQPAIDYLAMSLAFKYNKERAIVWNTYQMYLKHSPQVLKDHYSMTTVSCACASRGLIRCRETGSSLAQRSCVERT
jgi:proline dehydrogenase